MDRQYIQSLIYPGTLYVSFQLPKGLAGEKPGQWLVLEVVPYRHNILSWKQRERHYQTQPDFEAFILLETLSKAQFYHVLENILK